MEHSGKPFNILVTGGAGFIGTHLINKLVRRYKNPSIDIIDNLSNSSLPERRQEFFRKHGINFFKSSVEEFNFPAARHYDYIYHLASPVGPAGVLKYAGQMGAIILNGALKMSDIALRDKARLLIVSTSEVYGQNPANDKPQREDIHKVVPARVTVRLEYGVGKLLTEIALLNLSKVKPLLVNFIRPFNIVGPYQNGEAGFVLPRFVEAALKNEPITVFGDGTQKRTFTHVSDIVRAFLMLMESDCVGKIYNVGNPENVQSIRQVAEKVVAMSGSRSEIRFVDPKTIYGPLYEEAWNKIPDISAISNDLGWRPTYSFDDIMGEYVDFARGKIDIMSPDFTSAETTA